MAPVTQTKLPCDRVTNLKGYYVDIGSGSLDVLNTSNGQATYLTYAYGPSALNFNPDGTLDVIWTRDELQIPGTATLTRDILFARSY